MTNKTTVLLNNYYGYYFNTVDDLFVDSTGAVWFTDPQCRQFRSWWLDIVLISVETPGSIA